MALSAQGLLPAAPPNSVLLKREAAWKGTGVRNRQVVGLCVIRTVVVAGSALWRRQRSVANPEPHAPALAVFRSQSGTPMGRPAMLIESNE